MVLDSLKPISASDLKLGDKVYLAQGGALVPCTVESLVSAPWTPRVTVVLSGDYDDRVYTISSDSPVYSTVPAGFSS